MNWPDTSTARALKPIIKWAGGKGRLVPKLVPLLPRDVGSRRYIEPFAGGAAMFFMLRPQRALLGDVNPNLCAMYEAVRDHVEEVICELERLAAAHSRAQYYDVRTAYNRGPGAVSAAHRAAHFLYLNKTCFNGLHRLNRRGQFNVPAGDLEGPWSVDAMLLRAASEELRRVELRSQSFEGLLDQAGAADFVYLDPPYDSANGARSFTAYNAHAFGSAAQDLLRDVFAELSRRGCKLMQSNSDTAANRRRYSGFDIQTVLAPRAINRDAHGRGAVREIVIRNYIA